MNVRDIDDLKLPYEVVAVYGGIIKTMLNLGILDRRKNGRLYSYCLKKEYEAMTAVGYGRYE